MNKDEIETDIVKIDDFLKRAQEFTQQTQKTRLPIDAYRDNKELSLILKDAAFLIDTSEPGAKDAIEFIFKGCVSTAFQFLYRDWFYSTRAEEDAQLQRRNLELVDLLARILRCNYLDKNMLCVMFNLFNPNSIYHVRRTRSGPPSYESVTVPEKYRYVTGVNENVVLQEIIERFGKQGGFQYANSQLSSLEGDLVPLFLCTFKESSKVVSESCEQFFLPMKERISEYLASLTDKEIKSLDLRSDALSPLTVITSYAKILAHFRASQKALQLEHFNLLHRVLKLSTYNGRMFALNEIMTQLNSTKQFYSDSNKLSAKEAAEWTKEALLPVMLRDSLHLKQYVDRCVNVLIFMMDHDALTTSDIDMIWNAKVGAHPAIILNIDDLFASIADKLSDSLLGYLLDKFRNMWLASSASKKDREQLLGLVKRLSEDSRIGDKILDLLWGMATGVDVSEEILNDTLQNLVKILDNRSVNRDQRKIKWLSRLADEFKSNSDLTIPVIKLIELIGNDLPEPDSYNSGSMNRKRALEDLQNNEQLIHAVVMDMIKFTDVKKRPNTIHGHLTEISLRLSFIKYILQEARLYLEYRDTVLVWEMLVDKGDPEIRELGFTWFKSIMGAEPDLNPVSIFNFFASHILAMEPERLTRAGVSCFWFYFNAISTSERPSSAEGSENPSQDGINYLWKTLCSCDAVLAPDVIDIINNYYTGLVMAGTAQNHNDFFEECIQRIKSFHDTLKIITEPKKSTILSLDKDNAADKSATTLKICRIVDLFQKYLSHFPQNRMQDDNLALGKSWRGLKKIYTVQIEQQNIKLDMHSNSNIRHLTDRLHREFPNIRKDLIILPEQNSQHILESEQMLESSAKNEQVNFYARVVHERPKQRRKSIRPDDSLENHLTFITDIVNLMELALNIGEFALVSSIMKLVLVLPGDTKPLRIAIMKKKDLQAFFESDSQSMNWYNLCLLRSLLLPTEPTQMTRDVLTYFFQSNGPAAILSMLDLSKSKFIQTSRPEIILHKLETLAEVQRYITLIHVRSIGNTSVWDTLRCLDEYLYGVAESIALPPKSQIVTITPTIIQGTWQICLKVSKTSSDSYICGLFEEVYKTAFESLSWLLVTNKIGSFKSKDTKLRDSFFEFVQSMLLHQNSSYRRTTQMFLVVVYSGKYLNNQLVDKETTVKLANFLYSKRSMLEENPEVVEEIFSFTSELFDQFYIDSTLIEGSSRILEMIKWLEARIAAKEANEFLLKGHLELALVFFKSLTKTELLKISDRLLKILNEIIFPVSPLDRKTLREARASGCDNGAIEPVAGQSGDTPMSPRKLGSPLCDTQASVHAAMNLLVEMTKGVPENFQQVATLLKRNWHQQAHLERFDVVPTSQRKSKTGYVGLKNGGATCYLNAVVQQLFMIHPMKNALLSGQLSDPRSRQSNSADKQYRYKIFNIFQRLVGHLSSSEQTYFVPRQFWDHVKLCGQHINVRDQQDAMEFYSQIVDTLDEAMKDDGEPSAIQEYLGGTFSDQKICKDCPHRFSREEPFMSISVDVRSQHSLQESLTQFVKGDLLDGENSYYCETCDTKVAAIKRLCIAKLPTYLCIQLKRFDYDWEREESIKFNDYFEFPRVLNMAPFTEAGIDAEGDVSQNNYRLKGVVVHSGQASGGHYYSFVRETAESNSKWLKFDDCEVSEIDLSDEQLAGECFGGDQGEFWDGRRNQSARGRRWWNAYLLFYESIEETSIQNLSQGLSDISVNSSTSESFCVPAVDRRQMPVTMPSHIKQEVEQQNAEMRHQRMMFSQEFIDFNINLVQASYEKIREEWRRNGGKTGKGIRQESKQLANWALDLGMSFLVNIGSKLHQQYRKVNLLQSTEDVSWLTIIKELVLTDDILADSVLKYFTPEVLRQYLFVCQNEDIRLFVAKILAVCCQKKCSLRDRCIQDLVSISSPDNRSNSHVSEQYFLILDLLLRFPLQEGLTPPLYIFIEHGLLHHLLSLALQSDNYQSSYRQSTGMLKLYSLVATLARHCDVTRYILPEATTQSPYGKNVFIPNSDEVIEKPKFDPEAMRLFEDDKGANCTTFIKLLHESDSKKQTNMAFDFTKFILYANKKMSKLIGDDIVWNFLFGNAAEIPTFWSNLLACYCCLEDQLQHARIIFILKNAHEHGLIGIIEKVVRGLSSSNSDTRTYQAIKLIIELMASEDAVRQAVNSDAEITRSVKNGLKWLKLNLADAPTGHSNDLASGYDLVRTTSAENICGIGNELFDAASEPDTVSSTTSGTSESSSRYEPASK